MISRPEQNESGQDHYAYVTVSGKGSLANLTNAIGLVADESWDRDDRPLKGNRERYDFSRWSLFSGLARGSAIDDHISSVLKRLDPCRDGFAALGADWKKYIAVTGSFDDAKQKIEISVLNHRRAAQLLLEYDFDVYCDGM